MKYSEKMQLLLKGVKMSEIADLEKQEAEEQEAASAAAASESEGIHEGNDSDNTTEEETKTALQAALLAVKDLEGKLSAKEDELTKLNKQFADLNNKQTILDNPPKKPDASDVFKELFNPDKNKKEA